MAKKYPLKKAYIYKEKKMEITFNEQELSKVIEAGLNAVGYNAGTIESMNVTQSRKTGNASLTLEVNPFGLDVEETPTEQMELPLEEATTEEVVEEEKPELVPEKSAEPVVESTPEPQAEVVEPSIVEEESESLFGGAASDTTTPAVAESDSLFS